MHRSIVLGLFLVACGGGSVPGNDAGRDSQVAPQPDTGMVLPMNDAGSSGVTRVAFTTTAGNFVVEVHRDWSPNGVDHFLDLVDMQFYDDCGFFRVVPGFVVQFGMSGDPTVTANIGRMTI